MLLQGLCASAGSASAGSSHRIRWSRSRSSRSRFFCRFWDTRGSGDLQVEKMFIRSRAELMEECSQKSEPTRLISVWPGGGHPLVFASGSRIIPSWWLRGGKWGSGGGNWGFYRGYRFDHRFWGDRSGSGAHRRWLRATREAGVGGEEAVQWDAVVRHKLDQQLVAAGDDGSGGDGRKGEHGG